MEVEKANMPKVIALWNWPMGSFIWADPKRLIESKTRSVMAKKM